MTNQLDFPFDGCSMYAESQKKSYYNTTSEKGQILSTNKAKAKAQDFKVLQYFEKRKRKLISPTQVWEALFTSATPLTSVRRAISNLTKMGLLEKTAKKQKGIYGRDEYKWKLNIKNN